jgi:uncharacterized protein (TIGR00266 family)
MDYELIGTPDYGMVRVHLTRDDEVQAEAGAMVGMDQSVEMETSMKGGFMESAKRSVMGGESFFLNTFRAPNGSGRVELAAGLPGDVLQLDLGGTYGITRGAFLAADTSVTVDSQFGGFQGFFSGLGFGMLRASGSGDLYLTSFGGIREVAVDGEYVVDTGHILAFEDRLDFNVETVGGWKPTLLSGEGLVCRFRGEGTVYTQTRNTPSFASWLHPFRPVQSDDDE